MARRSTVLQAFASWHWAVSDASLDPEDTLMRHAARRAMSARLAASIMIGALLAGSVALAAPVGAAAVTPCNASIVPGGTVTLGTDQTITVSGLTPNGGYTITQTHNGSVFGPNPGTADATGGINFTLTYALGTWMDAWQDTTTGATCSVSWTVIDGPAPTTTVPTTTTLPAAPSATPAATAVSATPTFAG